MMNLAAKIAMYKGAMFVILRRQKRVVFSPAIFKDGELEFYKGIIPLVPSLLDWPFLEKKEGKWVPFEPKVKPLVQMGLYAEAFTLDELKKMKNKHKYAN